MKGKIVILAAILGCSSILTGYSQKNSSAYQHAPSGLKYKFIQQTDDFTKPQVGDVLTISLSYYINDSLLFDSKNMGVPLQFPLSAPVFKGDFFEGIAMMSKGDSASFLCNADSVFMRIFQVNPMPDFVKPNSTMRFEIGLKSFMTKAAFEAEKEAAAQNQLAKSAQMLDKYLKDNNITVKAQPSGLYYVEKVKGTGNKPVAGQRVRVHYKGTLLDGTKFDSSYDRNEPIEFAFGTGQVIKGWDEGIGLLQVGGKATLILPYNLAYGERGAGPIPPFSALVFEVELVEIIK